MEKRLFLAVFLSIAFLFAWGAIAPRLFPQLAKRPEEPAAVAGRPVTTEPPAVATSEPAPRAPSPAPAAERAPSPTVTPVAGEWVMPVTIESSIYSATFTNRGAQLTSFRLLRYPERKGGEPVDLVSPRNPDRFDFPFAIVSGDRRVNELVNGSVYRIERSEVSGARVVRFAWAGEGITVEKTFRFTRDQYLFGFEIRMSTPDEIPYRIVIGPGLRRILPEEEDNQFVATGVGMVQIGGDLETIQRQKAAEFTRFEGTPEFVGLQDNYFLAVLKPRRGTEPTLRAVELPPGADGGEPRRELYAGLNAVRGEVSGDAYFGPKEAGLLDRYGLENTLQFGVFGFIARLLLAALLWINTWTHNYGWAIIVLTAIIKILLYPLQHKSMVSMKKMQLVQPKMNAIKERYKKARTDPEQRQKMNTEMMKLYKQEGINPASGCVPLLLQLPILWAFYTLLSRAIELRGAPWILWIADLSVKDPYYITPILMTATMFIQQWLTPTTADPMQRRIFLAMPVVFGWLFKEFPSGLVLYWLVQNILSIVQQMITNRYWHARPATEEKGA
ncbi:MAG TPA: membrane protein insertase YidC [Thermoanaerobaculia bacterium]|nr:membrane protein insertase YidC [Thermoanaerobaculia bacterium]